MLFLSRVGFFLFFSMLAFSALSADLPEVEKIDINTAPLEDLVKIIHIGEVRARELISLRPFSSLDDLIRIKGIGKTRIEDIKSQGLAWVAEESPQQLKETVEVKDQLKKYPLGIVINEILPSPKGPDSENEWIEILNQNNFIVDLTNWQISDLVGATKIYTFSEGSILEANEFLLLPRPTTKITLNNDGDGLKLIRPDGLIVDSINYQAAPRGESYNRIDSEWIWSSNLTPGAKNIIPENTQEIKEESKKESETREKNLAAMSEIIKETAEETNFLPLIIALFIAVFSGIIILNLKKKVERTID